MSLVADILEKIEWVNLPSDPPFRLLDIEIKVLINPSRSERAALGKEVRGLVDARGNHYVWDAHNATHDDVERALGIDNVRSYYGGDVY